MGSAFMHGWISLPSEGEIYLEHGVPRLASIGMRSTVDVERLMDEIADLTGLRVTLGRWEPGEEAAEMEAAVHVDAADIGEVLRRLAHASAETFFDRYRRSIDADDIDFDDEAYAQDLGVALEVCGLRWRQVSQPGLRDGYCRALHQAAEEIARHPD